MARHISAIMTAMRWWLIMSVMNLISKFDVEGLGERLNNKDEERRAWRHGG